jgi:hypothetical protein
MLSGTGFMENWYNYCRCADREIIRRFGELNSGAVWAAWATLVLSS